MLNVKDRFDDRLDLAVDGIKSYLLVSHFPFLWAKLLLISFSVSCYRLNLDLYQIIIKYRHIVFCVHLLPIQLYLYYTHMRW